MRAPAYARLAAVTLTTSLIVALAACGSRIHPNTALEASGQGGANDVVDVSPIQGTSTNTGNENGPGDVTTVDGGGDIESSPDSGGEAGLPPGASDPEAGIKKGSCDGFDAEQPGITDSTIVIGNASDISGPIPGLFEQSRTATQAFVDFFNATSEICGRKLELMSFDSRSDSAANQQIYADACTKVFAMVGSMSAFDAGGSSTAEECGLPDLRAIATSGERRECSVCFASHSTSPGQWQSVVPKFFVQKFPEAADHIAVLFINAGSAPQTADWYRQGWSANGATVDYFQGIDTSEFNYATYVQAMKDRGIRGVSYIGPYQNTIKLLQTMEQQSFEVDFYEQDSTIYANGYVEQGGDTVDGSYVWMDFTPFEQTSQPEMALYRQWIERTRPGSDPGFYGVFSWSAARLFTQLALQLGGDLSREVLLQSLGGVKEWTANGLHAPFGVGASQLTPCTRVLQLQQSAWKQVSPGQYQCGEIFQAN